ncbi:MAG TPA: IclR family transcriptional regulator [Methylibium sp.]
MPATRDFAATSDATPGDADERAGIQSVEVGYRLLEALASAHGALALKDLAQAAGMNAAKAHRYLVSFQRLGLVVQEAATSHYDLGPTALRLGLAGLARVDAVRLARQAAARLCTQINHSTAVAVWGNHGPTIVHSQESRQPVVASLRLADVMPLLSSATGRCFCGWLPREQVLPLVRRELLQAVQQGRQDLPRTAEDFDALREAVRKRGAGEVAHTLLPGISALCHPVFDADGHLALGLLSLGPSAIFDPRQGGEIDRALGRAARELSRELGHRHDASLAHA